MAAFLSRQEGEPDAVLDSADFPGGPTSWPKSDDPGSMSAFTVRCLVLFWPRETVPGHQIAVSPVLLLAPGVLANAAGPKGQKGERTLRRSLGIALLTTALTVVTATGASAQTSPRDIEAGCPASRVLPAGFADTPGTTFASEVDCVVWWGVASGRSATSYGPSLSTNRAQMASFFANLIRASGGDLPNDAPTSFTDTSGSVHANNIDALAAIGVVAGTTATTYSPSRAVTRAQMATFITRTYGYLTGEGLIGDQDYFDDDNGSVHEDAINAIAQVGITGGDADGNFRPAGEVTRGAMAAFLARTLDLLVDTGFAEPPPRPAQLLTPGDIVSRSSGFGTGRTDDCRRGLLNEGVERINGKTYEKSLWCYTWDGESGWAEFDLGRDYGRFRATVGLGDASTVTNRVLRFTVSGDGATLFSETVGFGEERQIDADVSNVLRLRLEVATVQDAGLQGFSRAVWGDPTIGG